MSEKVLKAFPNTFFGKNLYILSRNKKMMFNSNQLAEIFHISKFLLAKASITNTGGQSTVTFFHTFMTILKNAISTSSNLKNLDRSRSGTMASSHIAVALSDSSSSLGVSVLTVHVVRSRSRVVSHPDTKVLHNSGRFLSNLFH